MTRRTVAYLILLYGKIIPFLEIQSIHEESYLSVIYKTPLNRGYIRWRYLSVTSNAYLSGTGMTGPTMLAAAPTGTLLGQSASARGGGLLHGPFRP